MKNQLIGRGNAFVEKQRLDALRHTVVLTKESSDPLITDPPHLVSANWDGTNLTLILSQPVNATWVWALQNMPGYSFLHGKEPIRFQFSGNRAIIAAREHEAQKVIDIFKGWLPHANSLYENKLRNDARRAEEQERRRLEDEVREAELRARVNQSIRI